MLREIKKGCSYLSMYLYITGTNTKPFFSNSRIDQYTHGTPSSQHITHRIQAWNFCKGDIPDLTDTESNLVVPEAKIHNDASVDISEDGSLLVTLVPSNLPMTTVTPTVVGVYGLSVSNKGRLFATYSLESLPVSVSLSPTSKHLMVGYSMRGPGSRLAPYSPSDRTLIAQIFRLKMPWECMTSNEQEQPPRGRLAHRRDLHQNEPGQTFLNCIRWIPVSGLGMVYATNTGLLKILR